VYWLGRQLFSRRVGLMAAALLAVNAYHIRYAQEVRSYSLYVLLTVLSVAAFVAFLQRPSGRTGFAHIAASALAFYAHFYAGLIVVVEWLAWRDERPPEFSGPAGAVLNFRWIAALVFPAILFAATTGVGPLNWIQRPGLHDLYLYYTHMAGNGGWLLLLLYLSAIAAALWPVRNALLPAMPQGEQPTSDRRRLAAWPLRLLLLWLLFPVLVVLVLSLVRPMFVPRYFVACLPAFVLLAAVGIDRLPQRWMILPLGVFLALSLQGTFSYYDHDFDLDRDNYRSASNYILDHAQPGDVILFHIAMGRMPYEFYQSLRAGAPAPAVIYPSRPGGMNYRDFLGKPSEDVLQQATNYNRIWVVLKNNQGPKGPDATSRMIDSTLGASHQQTEDDKFPGVEVQLYSR
jgi:hypothetical protein